MSFAYYKRTKLFNSESKQLVIAKNLILIAGILVFTCVTCVHATEDAADANKPGLFSGSDFQLGNNNQPSPFGRDDDTVSLPRMLLSLMLVAALAVAVMFLSKKVLPKVSAIAGKKVKVLETVSLGSRRAVHLLEVGNRQILIGSTQNTITRLADFPGEASDEASIEDIPDESEGTP